MFKPMIILFNNWFISGNKAVGGGNIKNEDPFKLMEIKAIKTALQKTKGCNFNNIKTLNFRKVLNQLTISVELSICKPSIDGLQQSADNSTLSCIFCK